MSNQAIPPNSIVVKKPRGSGAFRRTPQWLSIPSRDHCQQCGKTPGNQPSESDPLGEIFYDCTYYRPLRNRYSSMTVNEVTYTYGEPYINQRLSGHNERFAFTGKERDGETGFGYFGARYMDHELTTMWLSVDPMSDKYPSISPYNYCAWSPVKLVDPDGKEIWINGSDGNSYMYRKGMLYTADGKLYTGNDAFALNVCSDITELKESNQIIRWKISKMEKSNKMISINESTVNNHCSLDDDGQYNRKVGSGSTINYNPTKTSSVDGEREPRIGLAHELGHAYDAMRGKMDDTPCKVYKPIGGDSYEEGVLPYSEIRAVEFENLARPSNQQRTTYDKFELIFYLQHYEGSIDSYYGF